MRACVGQVREAAYLGFPFSFVTFLLGKQKKSKEDTDHRSRFMN
jgi:hypothetical protein